MKQGDIVYYTDELHDEIIDFKIKRIKIDEHYKYIHSNPFHKLCSFITYRILATPIITIYFKLIKRIRYENTKILKTQKNSGYFIYANHTNQFSDGFSPTIICFPKKPHIIVNPDNVSIPFWGRLTRNWGALPLPDTIKATKNFNKVIDYTLRKNNPILIYPEAHLWPYYTKIRPFDCRSFRYPIVYNKPVFTFTTTYHKRKHSKKTKIIIYVDGPFYPDLSLDRKVAMQKLRDQVYEKMTERAKLSDYEYVKYVKKEKQ